MKSSILRSRLDNIEKDLSHSIHYYKSLIHYHKYLIKEAEKKLKEIKKLKRIIK